MASGRRRLVSCWLLLRRNSPLGGILAVKRSARFEPSGSTHHNCTFSTYFPSLMCSIEPALGSPVKRASWKVAVEGSNRAHFFSTPNPVRGFGVLKKCARFVPSTATFLVALLTGLPCAGSFVGIIFGMSCVVVSPYMWHHMLHVVRGGVPFMHGIICGVLCVVVPPYIWYNKWHAMCGGVPLYMVLYMACCMRWLSLYTY